MDGQGEQAIRILLHDDAQQVAHVAAVLAGVDRFVAAGLWLEITAPDVDNPSILTAREALRHATMRRHRAEEVELPRAALFNEPWRARDRSGAGTSRTYRGREPNQPWFAAGDAFYAEWLRRELESSRPNAYADLSRFALVREISRSSPIRIEIGVGAATTVGVVVAGPWALAPAAVLALVRGAIDLRTRWSEARSTAADADVREAQAREATASARIAEARATTAEQLYAAAGERVNEAAIELAGRAALGGVLDLATPGPIARLEVGDTEVVADGAEEGE